MSAKVITVYQATQERDGDEGRGGLIPLGLFYNEDMAKKMCANKGVMGTQGQVLHKLALKLEDGRVFLLAQSDPVQVHDSHASALRELARKKLTPEEAAAVGL